MAVKTLLDAVTSTGAGSANTNEGSNAVFQGHGTTSSGTGAATIDVEVSADGLRWVVAGTITLALSTTEAVDGFAVQGAWPHVRGNVTAISGTGAAVTLKAGHNS